MSVTQFERLPVDKNGNIVKPPEFDFTELDKVISEIEEELIKEGQ